MVADFSFASPLPLRMNFPTGFGRMRRELETDTEGHWRGDRRTTDRWLPLAAAASIPLQPITVVTGPNGSGKSNLYRALVLIAPVRSGPVCLGAWLKKGVSPLRCGRDNASRGKRPGSCSG